jgi:hypothetical protein
VHIYPGEIHRAAGGSPLQLSGVRERGIVPEGLIPAVPQYRAVTAGGRDGVQQLAG